jgi:hypothetical protein
MVTQSTLDSGTRKHWMLRMDLALNRVIYRADGGTAPV